MGLDSTDECVTTPLLGSKGSTSVSVKQAPSQTRCGKICKTLSLVTVEPALLLLAISYGVELVFKTNMLVDKACFIQFQYSDDICTDLDSGDYKLQQDSVQKIAANYNMYCQIIEMAPGAVVNLFLGFLSDTRSRRLPLLISLSGWILKAFGLCCNAYWWSLPPSYILLASVPNGLTGGMMSAFMACYAYVSECSSDEGRTTRLAICGIMPMIGVSFGGLIGSAIYPRGGYLAVFGLQLLANVVAFIYIVIRIRNTEPKSTINRTTEEKKENLVSQLKRSLMAVLRKRPDGGRAQLLGHMFCIFLYMSSIIGGVNLMFLYTRKKFKWDYNQYTIWSVFNSVINAAASWLLLPLLSFRWGIDDTLLGFGSGSSQVFSGILIGTANKAWILYLAILIAGGGGMTCGCSRGAISKIVGSNELGAVFSVMGLFESLAPIAATPLYTLVYNATIDIFPGTVFLISGGITLIMCCIYTWLATAFPPTPTASSDD